MKPYLLFYGMTYYPNGGWEDFQGSFDTLEEAKAAVPAIGQGYPGWGHIVHDGAIVTAFYDDEQEWEAP